MVGQMTLRLRNTLTRRVEHGRAARARPRPDVHLRTDRLPLRPRREPAQQPARRPHPAGAPLPRHRRLPRQEHHRRRPPARRGLRPRPDPMLVAAGLEHKTPAEIADAYEAAFHADEAAVNILPAHVFPRATEHIPEMLDAGRGARGRRLRLRDARRQRLLRRRALRRATASCRATRWPTCAPATAATSSPTSAIRPTSRSGSPPGPAACSSGRRARWGEGFPGWHLECSAMAMRYLGPQFDIHTGGIDNVFPHHEDEIAQSAPIAGDLPARHWVHGEFLLMDGRKMAKSAGNFQRVTELADRGIDPLALPLPGADLALLAQARVLRPVDRGGRGGARVAAGRAPRARARRRRTGRGRRRRSSAPARPAIDRRVVARASPATARATPDAFPHHRSRRLAGAPLSTDGRALHDRFVAAIDDDLDMPVGARAPARDPARADPGRRAALADPRRRSRPRSRPRPRLGPTRAHRRRRRRSRPGRSGGAPRRRATPRGPRRTTRAPTRCATNWRGIGWDVIDGPDGSRLTRRGHGRSG